MRFAWRFAVAHRVRLSQDRQLRLMLRERERDREGSIVERPPEVRDRRPRRTFRRPGLRRLRLCCHLYQPVSKAISNLKASKARYCLSDRSPTS